MVLQVKKEEAPKSVMKDMSKEALVDKVNIWSIFKVTNVKNNEVNASYRIYFSTDKKKFQIFARLSDARTWAQQNNEAPQETPVEPAEAV